jgi:hypothetical protein
MLSCSPIDGYRLSAETLLPHFCPEHGDSIFLRKLGDPEMRTSSIDWAQPSMFLPEDGDIIQSPKRDV